MTPNPKTGLVEILDLTPKDGPISVFQFPIDVRETLAKAQVLKDGSPRFVLAESYNPGSADPV